MWNRTNKRPSDDWHFLNTRGRHTLRLGPFFVVRWITICSRFYNVLFNIRLQLSLYQFRASTSAYVHGHEVKDVRPGRSVLDPHVKPGVIIHSMQEREQQIPDYCCDVCFKHDLESKGMYQCVLCGCTREGG